MQVILGSSQTGLTEKMVAAMECGSKTFHTNLCAILFLDKTSGHVRYWFKWKEVVISLWQNREENFIQHKRSLEVCSATKPTSGLVSIS